MDFLRRDVILLFMCAEIVERGLTMRMKEKKEVERDLPICIVCGKKITVSTIANIRLVSKKNDMPGRKGFEEKKKRGAKRWMEQRVE